MGGQLPLLMMSKLVGAVGDKNSEASQKVKKIIAGVSSFALGYIENVAVMVIHPSGKTEMKILEYKEFIYYMGDVIDAVNYVV